MKFNEVLEPEVIGVMNEVIDGCMGDEKAGCITACPMHTDARKYIKLMGDGNGEEAMKVVRETLYLPGVLGRVCAHPCESDCKWNEKNNPMSIANIKRYIADNFDNETKWDLTKKEHNGKSVAVIGAGPAGGQACIDLLKEGFKVTLFEKLDRVGGMLTVGIPEYRLPRNIIKKEFSYIEKLGCEIKLNTEIGKDISFETIKNEYDAVIVAVGKSLGRVDKSLKNSDAEGVFDAASYLKEAAITKNVKGLGKNVLVIGGGDVSMDSARVSLRLPFVENVTVLCLEDSLDNMASCKHEVDGAIEEGVTIKNSSAIKDIIVDENNRVKKVITKKCVSMFDGNGKFNPSFDDTVNEELDVDTVIFAIGQYVDNSFANGNLKTNPNQTFLCDEDTLQSSNDDKVFIVGDASNYSLIVVEAMATAKRAVESVIRYINGVDLKKDRDLTLTKSYKTGLKREANFTKFEKPNRVNTVMLEVSKRHKNFNEVNLGFTKEQVILESSRCLQCQCKLCMTDCLMLNQYTSHPKALFKEYFKEGVMDMNKLIAYSCNECSQCTNLCPKDYDLKKVFMGLKRAYANENNGLAVLKEHEPNEKMQQKECSSQYCSTVDVIHNDKKEGKKTKYVFAPGCTVPAYNPEAMGKIMDHLSETLDGEVGGMLRCCGKVSKMMGQKDRFDRRFKLANDELDKIGADVIVTICPSCYMIYNQYSGKKVISYWELMRDKIGLPECSKNIGKNSDVKFNIHDPCATREITEHHDAIRYVMKEMGYTVEEKERIGTNTKCCGVGGMACSADPHLYKMLLEKCVDDCTCDSVVTYCGSCRGTVEAGGKDSLHILDLMFSNETYMKGQEKKRAKADVLKGRLEAKKIFDDYKED